MTVDWERGDLLGGSLGRRKVDGGGAAGGGWERNSWISNN